MNNWILNILALLLTLVACQSNKPIDQGQPPSYQEVRGRTASQDSIDVLTQCLSYRDTFEHGGIIYHEDLHTKIEAYPMDTISIVLNKIIPHQIPMSGESKAIRFADPPLGYYERNYIPIDLDLLVTKLDISTDTASCAIHSRALGGTGKYSLKHRGNSWQISDYSFYRR